MRIGIDARLAGETGLGRYVTRLIAELAALGAPESFVLFTKPGTEDRFAFTGWECIPTPARWYTVEEQLALPGLIRRSGIDLFHAPHWNVSMHMPVPFVVTIHDLILLSHPSRRATTLGPIRYAVKSLGHRLVLGHALRQARQVIAVSSTTRDRIVEYAPRTGSRITVIHEGGASLPAPTGPSPVSGRYVLYVGNAYPHKDVEGLLAAMVAFRALPAGRDVRLVWVGQDDYFSGRVRQSATWKELGDAVVYLGVSDDATLAAVYAGASLYLTVSREEGFGLPPLEAQALGVPVVASDIPAHREMLGNAAAFVPLGKPTVVAKTIAEIISDPSRRHALLAAGRDRQHLFSWKTMAQKTLATYRACQT